MGFDSGDVMQIEDVDVYLEEDGSQQEVDLRTVRDRFYGLVDDRIAQNDYGSSAMHSGSMGRSNDSGKSEKAREHYEEWMEDLEGVNVEMDVHTPYNVFTFDIVPRTDFEFDQVQTAPNIMKGRYDGSTELAIREWSHYMDADQEELAGQMQEKGWQHFLKGDQLAPEGQREYELGPTDILSRLASSGKNFKRNSHDDGFYRSMGTAGYDRENFDNTVTMIPELLLSSAFHKEEGINDQLRNNELAAPVFPYNVKIADLYDDMAFAIRPWMNKSLDGGVYEDDAEQFGTMYGTMEGLGLVTSFDRADEFADERIPGEGSVKTFFDPEFVGYTDNDRWFMGADWEDFAKQLNKHGKVGGTMMDRIKDRKNRVAESFDGRIDVLEEVPQTVDRDMFPREKIVETRV